MNTPGSGNADFPVHSRIMRREKSMKKLLSFLTCLTLVLALAGCAGESHEKEIKGLSHQ